MSAYSLDNLPHLASGAVISPNNEFLAVLGDQKAGTNIEAPLSTIKQALAEVLAERGGANGSAPIDLYIDGQKFARITGNYNSSETRRMRDGGDYQESMRTSHTRLCSYR